MHRPRKRFGQHFLVDDDVVGRITDVIAPQLSDNMVEIGPGLGVLTQELVDRVARYVAIEIDRDLANKLLGSYSEKKNFCLRCADVLTVDFYSLLPSEVGSVRVVGNLPYNITTPLLFYLLQYNSIIKDMNFMVQREVADRLVAMPGSKDYGRLSVMMQYFVEVEKLFDVAPQSFYPPPRVYSSFIRLVPCKKSSIIAEDVQVFSEVVKIAFTQRRKSIHNSLKKLVSAKQWQELAIDSRLRPEQLSIEQFVMISNLVGDGGGKIFFQSP